MLTLLAKTAPISSSPNWQYLLSVSVASAESKLQVVGMMQILIGRENGGGGAWAMTPFIPLSSNEQLLPLSKPLLLLPPPHPSPRPSNKNFGRRLGFAWTLFCIIKLLQLLKVKRHRRESILSGKYNKNNPPFLLAYRVGLRASQSIRQSM